MHKTNNEASIRHLIYIYIFWDVSCSVHCVHRVMPFCSQHSFSGGAIPSLVVTMVPGIIPF